MVLSSWKSDTQWKDMSPSQKLAACMEALGCELADIALLLGTKVTRLKKIFSSDSSTLRKFEDFMLYRLSGGKPADGFLTGVVSSPAPYDLPPGELDPILLQQLDIMGKATSLIWRIMRLCKEDSRFSEGDIVASLLANYGTNDGSCLVQVISPKYLPGVLVNISLREDHIELSCITGKLVPSVYNWDKITTTNLRQAAGRAKSFLTTLLNRSVWQKQAKTSSITA